MREPLTIAVAQPRCVSFDVEGNALRHADAVRRADARVVVFPELSLSGYEMEAPTLRADDSRLVPIVQACAATGALALAGAPVDGEAGKAHIALFAIDAGGVRVAHRKFWVAEEEARRFSPGDPASAIEVDGWRLGLAICREIWMPEHTAATAELGVHVYVASVLNKASESPLQHRRARRIAREHALWVAVASFAGATGEGYHEAAGRSGIWTREGEVMVQAGPDAGATVRATLSP